MENSEGALEKRRYERYAVEARVKIAVIREGKRVSLSGTAHDISVGGMSLFMLSELTIGEALVVSFALVFTSTVTIQGVVRARHGFEYGVEFVNLTDSQKEEILRNCRALSLLK